MVDRFLSFGGWVAFCHRYRNELLFHTRNTHVLVLRTRFGEQCEEEQEKETLLRRLTMPLSSIYGLFFTYKITA